MKKKEQEGVINSPNSLYHGMKLYDERRPSLSTETLLKMEVARLQDFLEFLFDHSEHCDHISYGDAWKEFMIYEAKNSYHRDQVQELRKNMREGKLKYDPSIRSFVKKKI